MIALMTTIRPPDWDLATVEERCRLGAEPYTAIPGLRSKTFWVDDAEREVGGFYLFDDARSADAFLDSERWRVTIPERWGCAPEARRLSSPARVVNDGGAGAVVTDPPTTP